MRDVVAGCGGGDVVCVEGCGFSDGRVRREAVVALCRGVCTSAIFFTQA
jgi:hypothetical protein